MKPSRVSMRLTKPCRGFWSEVSAVFACRDPGVVETAPQGPPSLNRYRF